MNAKNRVFFWLVIGCVLTFVGLCTWRILDTLRHFEMMQSFNTASMIQIQDVQLRILHHVDSHSQLGPAMMCPECAGDSLSGMTPEQLVEHYNKHKREIMEEIRNAEANMNEKRAKSMSKRLGVDIKMPKRNE